MISEDQAKDLWQAIKAFEEWIKTSGMNDQDLLVYKWFCWRAFLGGIDAH